MIMRHVSGSETWLLVSKTRSEYGYIFVSTLGNIFGYITPLFSVWGTRRERIILRHLLTCIYNFTGTGYMHETIVLCVRQCIWMLRDIRMGNTCFWQSWRQPIEITKCCIYIYRLHINSMLATIFLKVG